MTTAALQHKPLRGASHNRLACLIRHWTWADGAKIRFERALTTGWQSDADPPGDELFGAYYQWCALLCGFTEAALERAFLPASQMNTLRDDLEASLSELRACRQLLVVIPASREEYPRVVDLQRDQESLRRLRRVHDAFGEALREEQTSRELDFMDIDER